MTKHQQMLLDWLRDPENVVHVTVYWGFDGQWKTYARCYIGDKTIHLRAKTWKALQPYVHTVYENAFKGITFRRYQLDPARVEGKFYN